MKKVRKSASRVLVLILLFAFVVLVPIALGLKQAVMPTVTGTDNKTPEVTLSVKLYDIRTLTAMVPTSTKTPGCSPDYYYLGTSCYPKLFK
jgi:hypothetical protein